MATAGCLIGHEVPVNGIEQVEDDGGLSADEAFIKIYGKENLMKYCRVTSFEKAAFIGDAGIVNGPPKVRTKTIIFKADRFIRACIQSQCCTYLCKYIFIYVDKIFVYVWSSLLHSSAILLKRY